MKFLYLISTALALSDRGPKNVNRFLLDSEPVYITKKYENVKVYLTESDTYLATSCSYDSSLINNQDNLIASNWDNSGIFNVYIDSKDTMVIKHVDEKTNSAKYICPNAEYTSLSFCDSRFGFTSVNKNNKDYYIGSNEFEISSNIKNYPLCNDNSSMIGIKRGLNGKNLSIRIVSKDLLN